MFGCFINPDSIPLAISLSLIELLGDQAFSNLLLNASWYSWQEVYDV